MLINQYFRHIKSLKENIEKIIVCLKNAKQFQNAAEKIQTQNAAEKIQTQQNTANMSRFSVLNDDV